MPEKFAHEALSGEKSGHRQFVVPLEFFDRGAGGLVENAGGLDLAVPVFRQDALNGGDARRRSEQLGNGIVAACRNGLRRARGDGRTHTGRRFRRLGGGRTCGTQRGFSRQWRLPRIGEEWRRVRPRLQKNSIDYDDKARRDGAEDGQRIDWTMHGLRPQAKPDRCGDVGDACARAAIVVDAPVTHFASPGCRAATRRLRASPRW